MHMNNSHRILSEMYEQTVQQPIPENNRKNALGKLAELAKRKTLVQEYEAAVTNLWNAMESVESVSQDPILVAYAKELWDKHNQGNLNDQDQNVYDTFSNLAQNGDIFDPLNINSESDLSPLNHVEIDEGEGAEEGWGEH